MGRFFRLIFYILKSKFMKSIFFKIVIISLFTQLSFAQEGENPGFDQYSSSIFDSKENALNLVSKMAPNSSSLIGNSSSGVIIQQIGDSNTINANLKTATSTANFTAIQNGDLNLMNVQKNANAINQAMLQEGNNNTISDFTYYTSYNVNMEILQQGDNSNIQNYGTNSLSKDMKITQTGNGAELIIINQ